MFRQTSARLGVSIEEGTEHVPADGRYYVIEEGMVRKSFKSLRGALALYERLREARRIDADEPSGESRST